MILNLVSSPEIVTALDITGDLTFSDKKEYDRIRENDKFDTKGHKEYSAGKRLPAKTHKHIIERRTE
jgi:hypothetical protein